MQAKLNQIAEKAKRDKGMKFTALMHHIHEDNLVECFSELKKDKASGIDGVTVEGYGRDLEWNVFDLVERLKSKNYHPKPVKRVYIPKAGNKDEKRGLGIPTIEDKLVQVMLKKILEAIFEPKFVEFSHGFRSYRNCHTALKELNEEIMKRPINFIVEVDIRKFFDTVKHYWLLRCLEERISDPNLLGLIRKFLKAGVVEAGQYHASKIGTPQGGIISPLLANIYLHYVLDIWFEKIIKPGAKGYMKMVRYCDDFVVCCESECDAKEFLQSLEERFAKFGLSLSTEKTQIIKFGRQAWKLSQKSGSKPDTFNFLGFTHYCAKSLGGYFVVGHKTSKDNLNRKLKEIKMWIINVKDVLPLKVWWPQLQAKLIGHYSYFGVSKNIRCLKQFYHGMREMAFKWLNRRSQRKSMTRERFTRYVQWNPLPLPRLYHTLYIVKANKAKASLGSRVWENHKHGSAGVTVQ